MVEPAVVAQGDDALVDAVVADPEVRVDDRRRVAVALSVGPGRPRRVCAGRGRGGVAGCCSSRRTGRAGLAGSGRSGRPLAGEPVLEGLVEAFDFAAGLGVVGP